MPKYLDQSGVTALTKEYDNRYANIADTPSAIPASVVALILAGINPADIDPVLENNSWATIRAVCELGLASNYWQVGDTKNVVGGDGYTRPVMIVDMQGLYGKHVVFQFRLLSENAFVWDADNVNDYSASDMMLTHLNVNGDAYLAIVDAALGAELTNTTVKVAKGGKDGTLVDVTGKLFLPAMKELTTSPQYSRTEEDDALTTFQYYVIHNTQSDRALNQPSTSSSMSWWLRSPSSGTTALVCRVLGGGNLGSGDIAVNSWRVAPCFSF